MDTASISLSNVPVRRPVWTALERLNELYLKPLLYAAVAAWLVYNAFNTISRVTSYYTPLPMWDYWRVVENLKEYKALHLEVFWRQHNEHRIIFPELVFASDMLFLHGRQILPLVTSFLCYLVTWAILSSPLYLDSAVSSPERFVAICLAGVMAFWEGSADVLAIPFLLQWTLMQVAVAAAFLGLSRLRQERSNRALTGTVAAAVVATFSSGNALVLWPLVLGVALLLRLKKKQMAVLLASAAVNLSLYFVGYRFSSSLKLRNFTDYPVYAFQYIASYLSMPFGGIGGPAFGVRTGMLGVAVTVSVLLVAWRRGLLASPPSVVLFSYYGFTLLTAVMTACGRMNPADPMFQAAKASRYLTVPQMNWAVVILLLLWISARLGGVKQFTGAVAILALGLGIYLAKLAPWLGQTANYFSEQQLAALSIENQILEPELARKIYPDVAFLSKYLPVLRDAKLSIYYRGQDRFLAQPLGQYGTLGHDTVSGIVSQITPVHTGYQVSGWADVSHWRTPYKSVVLVGEDGRVLGFGRRFAAGLPDSAKVPAIPEPFAWVGFFSSRFPVKSVSAYLTAPRHRILFPLATGATVPPAELTTRDYLKTPIQGVHWDVDPSGQPNILPGSVDFGQVPPTPVLSSWAGSDANSGAIRSSSFPRPVDNCLILPILRGPSVAGLSVELKDSRSEYSKLSLPLGNGLIEWQYWKVLLPPSFDSVSIEAIDKGKDHGQWIALSAPYQCR